MGIWVDAALVIPGGAGRWDAMGRVRMRPRAKGGEMRMIKAERFAGRGGEIAAQIVLAIVFRRQRSPRR